MKNNKKELEKDDKIGKAMAFAIVFALSITYLSMVYYATYYEYLNPENIEYISFYTDNDNPKNRILLLKIDNFKDIDYFLSNYWGKLETAMSERAFGQRFIIKIKETDETHEFIIRTSDRRFALMYPSSNIRIKSNKLYSFLKLLEKQEMYIKMNKGK